MSDIKILIVDNEPTIRHILLTRLTLLGYKVFSASDGKEALILFKKLQPDLVILELLLPKIDGYNVCLKIRANSQIPIILITSLRNLSNTKKILNLGATDCLLKPFLPKQVEQALRRIYQTRIKPNFERKISPSLIKSTTFEIANLVIDINNQKVWKNNESLTLTITEFNILMVLVENAGKPLSRLFILNRVWGYTPERLVDTRIVDVNIARLRAKLETKPTQPYFVITVRGRGYFFRQQ